MIEELVARVESAAGISPETARNALGVILGFIEKEAPDLSQKLLGQFPGVQDLIAESNQATSGGLSGMLGNLLGSFGGGAGDLMALGSKLMGQGLSMDQAKNVAGEVLSFAREKVGDDHVDALLNSIPGLSQIL